MPSHVPNPLYIRQACNPTMQTQPTHKPPLANHDEQPTRRYQVLFTGAKQLTGLAGVHCPSTLNRLVTAYSIIHSMPHSAVWQEKGWAEEQDICTIQGWGWLAQDGAAPTNLGSTAYSHTSTQLLPRPSNTRVVHTIDTRVVLRAHATTETIGLRTAAVQSQQQHR